MKISKWIAVLLLCAHLQAADICGFWNNFDQAKERPTIMVGIYEYQGLRYGRILGCYNDQGVIDDSIYHPKGRAPGVVGEPYYAGLDFIFNLRDAGTRYKGKITDPEKGKVYNASLWVREDGSLAVRGELFIFGQTQYWSPAEESNFTADFKKPDLKSFVPVIPEVVE